MLGEVLQFHFVKNSGAAFSLASALHLVLHPRRGLRDGVHRVVRASHPGSTGWAVLFGMLLGGTTGNLTDRLFREPSFGQGHVIDFLQVWGFPAIFNFADSFIVASMGRSSSSTVRGIGLDGRRASHTAPPPADAVTGDAVAGNAVRGHGRRAVRCRAVRSAVARSAAAGRSSVGAAVTKWRPGASRCPDGLAGERVDAAIAKLLGFSRSFAATVIDDGGVTVDGEPVGKSERLKSGEWLEVAWTPRPKPPTVVPMVVPGFTIVYDDDDIVVIDKPVGMAAHPSVGFGPARRCSARWPEPVSRWRPPVRRSGPAL